MFPVTHLYFYSTLFPKNNQGGIGAIFPDTTLHTGLRWPQTHRQSVDFYNSTCPEEKKKFASFFNGLFTHSVDSLGLDYYGDEKYEGFERGYAYLMAQNLVPEVVEVCKIPSSMGFWKAHNFIEMGIESLIGEKHPELASWIEEMGKDRQTIKEISQLAGKYYHTEEDIIYKGTIKFLGYIKPSGNTGELGESYARVLKARHDISDARPQEISRLIEKAKLIIQDGYMDVLLYFRKKFESPGTIDKGELR